MLDAIRFPFVRPFYVFVIISHTLFVAPQWCRGQFDTQFETRRLSAGPSVTITASYPEADAVTIAKIVAEPIESALQGMEQLAQLRSWSTLDGKYRLDAQFMKGANSGRVTQSIRARIETLESKLPVSVRPTITIDKTTPELAVIVVLDSPNGERDKLFLAQYARKTLKNDLARLPHVNEISELGFPTFRQRLQIDAAKLNARKISLSDLATAVKSEDGAPKSILFEKPPELENRVVSTTPDGQSVLIRDVALVENVSQWAQASWNGKPVIALGIHAEPSAGPKVQQAVEQALARLRMDAPTGVGLTVGVDFGHVRGSARNQPSLLVDLFFPESASPIEIGEKLQRWEAVLNQLDGVEATFASSTHLFDVPSNRPCLFVRCVASRNGTLTRDRVAAAIRSKLRTEAPDSMFWIRTQTPRGFDYPVRLALVDTDDTGYLALQDRANRCVTRLRERTRLFTDVISGARALASRLQVDIDEARAKDSGVSVPAIRTALQLLGWPNVAEFNGNRKDLNELKLRSDAGKLIPLGSLIVVREALTPALIQRLDGNPMAEITANLQADVTPSQARTALTRLATELNLPNNFRLVQFSE